MDFKKIATPFLNYNYLRPSLADLQSDCPEKIHATIRMSDVKLAVFKTGRRNPVVSRTRFEPVAKNTATRFDRPPTWLFRSAHNRHASVICSSIVRGPSKLNLRSSIRVRCFVSVNGFFFFFSIIPMSICSYASSVTAVFLLCFFFLFSAGAVVRMSATSLTKAPSYFTCSFPSNRAREHIYIATFVLLHRSVSNLGLFTVAISAIPLLYR